MGFSFSGNFTEGCQEHSVPTSLKSLVSMILGDVNIENTDAQKTQECLIVCQTILFSAKEKTPTKSKAGQTRHTKSQEPPLPLFIYSIQHLCIDKDKTLITKLYQMGVSVSYQRVLELMNMIATVVSERFDMDGCVALACLRNGVFAVGAFDNLDHNPSSTTAVSSFHGTAVLTCFRCQLRATLAKKGHQWLYYRKAKATPFQRNTLQ